MGMMGNPLMGASSMMIGGPHMLWPHHFFPPPPMGGSLTQFLKMYSLYNSVKYEQKDEIILKTRGCCFSEHVMKRFLIKFPIALLKFRSFLHYHFGVGINHTTTR